ncbi:phospholipase D family protein [Paenibacillus sp. VCA1]|uniref:phospholipase D family protein n=1 Tax=Paenibacillus sp. VCA1 TaxID=3039148 RepID=UPI0028716B68|nr:phospholipase D family protein [Paenibacillus sp. VCA1]MDR9855632.1 phospholipase D family protein [Paenibacillus sp. VCA1]
MDKWVWEKGYITKAVSEKKINKIIIVSAFFSDYGLDIIREIQRKNNLQKSSILIYLSKEFSLHKPGDLLEKLTEYAIVYIVHKLKLHAKLFLFYTTEGVQIYHGSANFTRGGLENNLELTQEIVLTDTLRLEEFIEHCHEAAVKAESETIQQYKDIDEELTEFAKINRYANQKIAEIFMVNGDPFSEMDYDLDSYYFTFQDYETLFPKYHSSESPIIRKRRDEVRRKLLNLNDILKYELVKLNLHNHWASSKNPKWTTSQIEPSSYNHDRVSWICVRYGKHKKNALLGGGSAEHYESFVKHACMQVTVVEDGIQIGLFHATANGAIDRNYLRSKIDSLRDEIHYQIAKLRGEQLVWHIYDPKANRTIRSFKIDEENPNDFVDFYKKYDAEGYESFCISQLQPDDENLKTVSTIVQIAKGKIEKMHPLYRLITWTIQN